MVTMREVAQLVHAYAPRLDEVDKVRFCLFIHNNLIGGWRNGGLDELNLAIEWLLFNQESA